MFVLFQSSAEVFDRANPTIFQARQCQSSTLANFKDSTMANINHQMETTASEIKAVAKSIGKSLKTSGHDVPHSVLLHAVSAALDKRNWHVLKAALSSQATHAPVTPQATRSVVSTYSESARFWVKLAYLCRTPVKSLPADSEHARDLAKMMVGKTMQGALTWAGKSVSATLQVSTSSLDAGDFNFEENSIGTFRLWFTSIMAPVGVEVAYTKKQGWYVTKKGEASFMATVDGLVTNEQVELEAKQGPGVSARFWTDDKAYEVNFDAQEYLCTAEDSQLEAIIYAGYRGSDCTEAIAEFMAGNHVHQVSELVEAFEYLSALQKAPRTNTVGYECAVNPKEFLQWMEVHQPILLATILCGKHNVRVFKSNQPENFGQWQWEALDTGEQCEDSFDSMEEAAFNASKRLKLLDEELQS